MQIEKDFTTQLDRDLTLDCIQLNVNVLNKDNTIYKTYSFSQSFNIHEIYILMRTKHPNKNLKLIINLKQ